MSKNVGLEEKGKWTADVWQKILDASKVPPSQFQRRKGSVFSTPSSRDSQHNNAERDKAYHEKLKEKVGSRSELRVGRFWKTPLVRTANSYNRHDR